MGCFGQAKRKLRRAKDTARHILRDVIDVGRWTRRIRAGKARVRRYLYDRHEALKVRHQQMHLDTLMQNNQCCLCESSESRAEELAAVVGRFATKRGIQRKVRRGSLLRPADDESDDDEGNEDGTATERLEGPGIQQQEGVEEDARPAISTSNNTGEARVEEAGQVEATSNNQSSNRFGKIRSTVVAELRLVGAFMAGFKSKESGTTAGAPLSDESTGRGQDADQGQAATNEQHPKAAKMTLLEKGDAAIISRITHKPVRGYLCPICRAVVAAALEEEKEQQRTFSIGSGGGGGADGGASRRVVETTTEFKNVSFASTCDDGQLVAGGSFGQPSSAGTWDRHHQRPLRRQLIGLLRQIECTVCSGRNRVAHFHGPTGQLVCSRCLKLHRVFATNSIPLEAPSFTVATEYAVSRACVQWCKRQRGGQAGLAAGSPDANVDLFAQWTAFSDGDGAAVGSASAHTVVDATAARLRDALASSLSHPPTPQQPDEEAGGGDCVEMALSATSRGRDGEGEALNEDEVTTCGESTKPEGTTPSVHSQHTTSDNDGDETSEPYSPGEEKNGSGGNDGGDSYDATGTVEGALGSVSLFHLREMDDDDRVAAEHAVLSSRRHLDVQTGPTVPRRLPRRTSLARHPSIVTPSPQRRVSILPGMEDTSSPPRNRDAQPSPSPRGTGGMQQRRVVRRPVLSMAVSPRPSTSLFEARDAAARHVASDTYRERLSSPEGQQSGHDTEEEASGGDVVDLFAEMPSNTTMRDLTMVDVASVSGTDSGGDTKPAHLRVNFLAEYAASQPEGERGQPAASTPTTKASASIPQLLRESLHARVMGDMESPSTSTKSSSRSSTVERRCPEPSLAGPDTMMADRPHEKEEEEEAASDQNDNSTADVYHGDLASDGNSPASASEHSCCQPLEVHVEGTSSSKNPAEDSSRHDAYNEEEEEDDDDDDDDDDDGGYVKAVEALNQQTTPRSSLTIHRDSDHGAHRGAVDNNDEPAQASTTPSTYRRTVLTLRDIYFYQDSCSARFSYGDSFQKAVNELRSGAKQVEDFPVIEVIKWRGRYYGMGNRRLACFHYVFHKDIDKTIPVDLVEIADDNHCLPQGDGLRMRVMGCVELDGTFRTRMEHGRLLCERSLNQQDNKDQPQRET